MPTMNMPHIKTKKGLLGFLNRFLPNLSSGSAGAVLGKRRVQLLYVSMSLMGLILLALLAHSPSVTRIHFGAEKPVTGVLFLLICAYGLVAAVAPSKVRGFSHGASSDPHTVGHHPDCGAFEGHVLVFSGKALCAGCTGLALGAVLAILGGIAYFFGGFFVGGAEAVFWAGAALVSLGVVQHFIDMGNAVLHLVLNVFFVFGAFLLAASLSELGAGFYVEAYLLGLVVFWILARVRVSQEEHIRVCSRCEAPCSRGFF
ncbi:hypothetical protein JXL21_14140 [Candidatus Bathyarchaeota archaeon]|nr:hypothetical protein [Candidatus Bathyarchaeota archaeon]